MAKEIRQQPEEAAPEIIDTLKIAVYGYASERILSVDFRWLNLKVYHLESEAFQKYLSRLVPKKDLQYHIEHFKKLVHNSSGYHPNLYAFVPIDKNEPISEGYFDAIEDLFLIMFPSDFQLRQVTHFKKHNETGKCSVSFWLNQSRPTLYTLNLLRDINDVLLDFDLANIKQIKIFFKLAWERLKALDYLQITMAGYLANFRDRNRAMKYVNLCIALESICNGNAEVTYRLARTCALLNSETIADGRQIFENVKNLYDLRSKIVHGNSLSVENNYYHYLLALTSRTIIELISLNIPTKTLLNQFVTAHGYEDKRKISNGYKKATFYQPPIDKLKEKLLSLDEIKEQLGKERKAKELKERELKKAFADLEWKAKQETKNSTE